jgi:hypothetical protein
MHMQGTIATWFHWFHLSYKLIGNAPADQNTPQNGTGYLHHRKAHSARKVTCTRGSKSLLCETYIIRRHMPSCVLNI